MPGRRALTLTLVLALLMSGGHYLVPLAQKRYRQWNMNRELAAALDSWKSIQMEQAIAAGADVNLQITPTREVYGALAPANALELAIFLSQPKMIRRFIRQGADIHRPNRHQITPLMFAAFYARGEAVRELVRAGAVVNARGREGLTPLMYAAMDHGRSWDSQRQVHIPADTPADAVNALLAAGADPNLTDPYGRTALSLAEQAEEPKIAAALPRWGQGAARGTCGDT